VTAVALANTSRRLIKSILVVSSAVAAIPPGSQDGAGSPDERSLGGALLRWARRGAEKPRSSSDDA
jgi:hypothetical protein